MAEIVINVNMSDTQYCLVILISDSLPGTGRPAVL